MTSDPYIVSNLESIYSPSLMFFADLIESNLKRVVEIAGSPDKLRPHVKTHKCPKIVEMAMRHGITKHKCATVAEAEMLATCGVPDVLIAYPLVGPNLARLVKLIRRFPGTSFATLIDHPTALMKLADVLNAESLAVRAVLDLDVGQHRTGVTLDRAEDLYRAIGRQPNFIPDGFQVYDGHNTQPDRAAREAGVDAFLAPVLALREKLERSGLPVPRLVCGGTPSFPVHAMRGVPGLECSPGTFVLHDANYGQRFVDLQGFQPAALVLTRVVSKPAGNRVTFDVGTKSIASDPPAGKRLKFVGFDNFNPVAHNEEHFTVETPEADRFQPGDRMYAIPAHVCPTVALHAYANVVKGGQVAEKWPIIARDRVITI